MTGRSAIQAMLTCPPIAERLRIACMGDSLTRGDGLHEHPPLRRVPWNRLRQSQQPLRERGSYPALLARLAASRRAEVRNFGHGGSTACNYTGGHGPPYESLPEYAAAQRFAPHIVVLMLGTNDAKPSFWSMGPCAQWGREPGHGLRAGLTSILATFRRLPQPPKLILLLTPPPLLGSRRLFEIDPLLLSEARRMVAEVQAQQDVAGTMRVALAHAAVPRTSLLFAADSLHLNADGSALLACAVHAQLRRWLYLPCGRPDGGPTASTGAGAPPNRSCWDPFCVATSDEAAARRAADDGSKRRVVLSAAEVADDAHHRQCDADSGSGAPMLYTGMACTLADPTEPHRACERMAAAYGVDLRAGLLPDPTRSDPIRSDLRAGLLPDPTADIATVAAAAAAAAATLPRSTPSRTLSPPLSTRAGMPPPPIATDSRVDSRANSRAADSHTDTHDGGHEGVTVGHYGYYGGHEQAAAAALLAHPSAHEYALEYPGPSTGLLVVLLLGAALLLVVVAMVRRARRTAQRRDHLGASPHRDVVYMPLSRA